MRKIKTLALIFLSVLLITVGCREEEPAEIACGTNRYHTDKKEIFLEDLVWAKNNPNLLANCATDEERIALSALRGSFVSAIEYNKFSEIDSILIPTVQELPYKLNYLEGSDLWFRYFFYVPTSADPDNQYPPFHICIYRKSNSFYSVADLTPPEDGGNEVTMAETETHWIYNYYGRAVMFPRNDVLENFQQTASTILFDHYLITSNGAVLLESGINLTQEEQPFAP